jgi:DNA (cytosine-5)-methyltransferase 1
VKLISLFSGIGGFEIAAEAVGWDVAVSCEINPFGRRVLQYHFPNAYHHDNVKTLNFETINEKLTERYGEWQSDDIVLTGGFPCQPFSSAGKRQGKDDERYLFPEMLRVIREVRPAWVVAENVRGLLSLGNGMVFDEVLTYLENEHYEVLPFVLPAAGVNAPHRRDRVWVIGRNASDTDSTRISGQPINTRTSEKIGQRREGFTQIRDIGYAGDWHDFPTQPPIRKRDDGISNKLLIFVVNELYGKISNTSKENRIENLPEVWEKIQSPEIWEQIRRLYSHFRSIS